jgi:steroid 5-alpha reductase family enzyme
MIISLVGALVTLFLYMCFVFVVALFQKNMGIADIAYGWGFVLIALFTLMVGQPGVAGILATMLSIVWAARLSVRIYLRNKNKPEDYRYASMREKWMKGGKASFAINSFFQVFMLQGLIIFIVALPVSLLNVYGAGVGLTLIGILGVIVWFKGFFFEAVGDYQLANFMKDKANKGKIMDKGLWHYTRHPNYYGESLMWWGLAIIAFGSLLYARGVPLALLPLIGPILITFLLLKVSGVPLLEKRMEGNPAWEEYKKKTSVFVPWFPKK